MKAGRSGIHRRALQAVLLACALAIALPALALGLGRIVVKSAPGQPLAAEIPVVAADPSELADVQVRLASADTYRRVGLPAPDAATASLRFTMAVDGRGQPVIRVTSAVPLRQPLLTFLVEVDWGAGRLVREYSALLEAPSSLAAPAQPIQAPTVAAPNTIAREPEPAPAPAPAAPALVSAPDAAIPAAAALPPPSPAESTATPAESTATPAEAPPVVAEPLPEPVPPPVPAVQPAPPAPAAEPAPPAEVAAPAPSNAIATAPASAAAKPAAESSAASRAAAAAYTVRAGETLSGIAVGLDRGARSLDQMMLALLQANPEAFIDGNINRIREGAVLRAPSDEALARYGSSEAAALVRQQVAQWRQAAAARAGRVAASEGAASAASPVADVGGDERRAADAREREAHLQIVPPASGKDAGTQSGAQAGGEGTMLRQEIQESRETLAARDAEVGELKTRVAELEKIQQQQQQLIAMKDTALAEARANLAKAQQSAVQAPVPATQPDAQAAARDTALWPWLLLALLLIGAGAWLWKKKRGGGKTGAWPFGPVRMPQMPRGRAADVPAPRAATAPAAVVPSFAAQAAPAPAPTAPEATAPAATAPAAPAQAPVVPPPAAPAPAAPAAPASSAPDWTAAPTLVGTMPPASPASPRADENVPPARQVELARAYLDLGDESAARELLREAMDGRDPVAREIAARMLRELG